MSSSKEMYVLPPKLQDLSSWPLRSKSFSAKEMWEIRTPPDRSLYWSIVLSFVIASSENSEWLDRLLGSKEEMKELMLKKNIPVHKLNSKSIKEQVMNFNPFKNQHAFFYNKGLINVVRMFSLRLNRTATEMKNNVGDDSKLMAVTKMLKCCIEVYEIDSEGKKPQPIVYAPVVGRKILYLFKYTGVRKEISTNSLGRQDSDHKVIDIFAFGMSLHHVVALRRDALGHILKRTKLSQQIIKELQDDFTGKGDFLISLLGKDSRLLTVPSIYASPYVAWKLDAAGFVTDPCISDSNGLSAFYHCMGLDSTLLLQVLYDYASNSFKHSDKTTRNPDEEILAALIKIGQTLQNDYAKSQSFAMLGDKQDIALKCYKELLCYNEYQCCVVERISELQGKLAIAASTQESKSNCDTINLSRKRCIIKSLLNLYPNYYNFSNVNLEKDTDTSEYKHRQFKSFVQCSEYYENLDNYTCLLFFDNFLYLDLPVGAMKSAVQNLFLTVFGYSLFPKCVHGVHCTKHALSSESCTLRTIPFVFRSNFLENTKIVLEELNRHSLDDANESEKRPSEKEQDPDLVVRQVTSLLKDLPEIKDEFLIGRLKKYLEVASEVEINDEDMKGVLTIERALQVIGEILNTTESNSVIGHLLCSCLPKEAVEEFFKIRNHCLSHYRPRLMGGKLSLEKEILRFKDMQDVIKEVHSMVYPVYVSQLLRIIENMVARCLCKSKDIHVTMSENMEREHNGIVNLWTKKFIINQGKYKCLTNNLLNYIEMEAGDNKCHKFRKIGQISTLKFLFTFLADQCDETIKNDVLRELQDLSSLSKDFEAKANGTQQRDIDISSSESQEITKIVSNLRKIAECIFSEVKDEPRKIINPSAPKTYFRDIKSFSWFTDEEMSIIKEKISECMQLSREAKGTLRNFFLGKSNLTEREAQELVVSIFASQKIKKCIVENISSNKQTALKSLSSAKKDEQDVFKKKNDQTDDIDYLIVFTETEEGIDLLLNIEFSEELHQKVLQFLNRKIEFLLDRISHLKSILIGEDEEILSLWNWGKSEAIKTHTRYLMGQRYRREKDVRLSLEMLLFDCMNILQKRGSLSRLWTKTNDLFSGANLRNILSHGNTILEIVGGCLDKDDLPSHFIAKMLELIEDGDALKKLSELWMKTRITDLKRFENLLEEDDPSLWEVQKWMKKRTGNVGSWRDYLPLFPLKSDDTGKVDTKTRKSSEQ